MTDFDLDYIDEAPAADYDTGEYDAHGVEYLSRDEYVQLGRELFGDDELEDIAAGIAPPDFDPELQEVIDATMEYIDAHENNGDLGAARSNYAQIAERLSIDDYAEAVAQEQEDATRAYYQDLADLQNANPSITVDPRLMDPFVHKHHGDVEAAFEDYRQWAVGAGFAKRPTMDSALDDALAAGGPRSRPAPNRRSNSAIGNALDDVFDELGGGR